MKKPPAKKSFRSTGENLESELLILPDGRILTHNLTQPFAELLHKMNPGDEQISSRAARHPSLRHELSN